VDRQSFVPALGGQPSWTHPYLFVALGLVHRRVGRVVRDYKQIVFVGNEVLRTLRGGPTALTPAVTDQAPRDVQAGERNHTDTLALDVKPAPGSG